MSRPEVSDAGPSGLAPEERIARLRLIRSDRIGPVTFHELLDHYGSAIAAIEAVSQRTRRGRSLLIASRDAAEEEFTRAADAGAVAVFFGTRFYPLPLAAIPVAPPVLFVKGRADLLARDLIAIVGSRLCSAAGRALTRRIAGDLGRSGLGIVSGLARGIDRAAHEAAMETGTVAVLAGGIDVVYPPEHAGLQSEIGEHGCLVTEQPPGFQPRGQDFPRRNRIISGLAWGTLVVEAARRSGSLVTARYATEQGRDVFAVPGHPLDPRAEGTNAMLKGGAVLVTDADDILAELEPARSRGFTATANTGAAESATPPLTPPAVPVGDVDRNRVLSSLGPAPTTVDAILDNTGLPARVVQAILIELALDGRVERDQGQSVSLVPDQRD